MDIAKSHQVSPEIFKIYFRYDRPLKRLMKWGWNLEAYQRHVSNISSKKYFTLYIIHNMSVIASILLWKCSGIYLNW